MHHSISQDCKINSLKLGCWDRDKCNCNYDRYQPAFKSFIFLVFFFFFRVILKLVLYSLFSLTLYSCVCIHPFIQFYSSLHSLPPDICLLRPLSPNTECQLQENRLCLLFCSLLKHQRLEPCLAQSTVRLKRL